MSVVKYLRESNAELTSNCFMVETNYIYCNKWKDEKVGVLPIRIVKSNVSSVSPSSERKHIRLAIHIGSTPIYFFLFLSDEGHALETLDFTIRIGSTPTFSYFDLYLYSAYAAHYVFTL